MMSKFFVFALAALMLTACASTERADVSAPGAHDTPRPRIVVRGAVVPDDPEPQSSPTKTRSATAKAGTSTAALSKKASAAVTAAAKAAAEALAATPETPAAAPAPVVETALPTVAVNETKPAKPNTMSTDITAIIQSVIGGMPVWLMALIGVVLLAAVALGFSGGRKSAGEA